MHSKAVTKLARARALSARRANDCESLLPNGFCRVMGAAGTGAHTQIHQRVFGEIFSAAENRDTFWGFHYS